MRGIKSEITDLTHGCITVRLIADAFELQQQTRQAAHLMVIHCTARVIAIGTFVNPRIGSMRPMNVPQPTRAAPMPAAERVAVPA